MTSGMNRRNFLQLISLLPLSIPLIASSNPAPQFRKTPAHTPNILIVIFDALSAFNVSLYGYRRETMPNLARFAERATVYHAHYAAGNFTTPGTTSLLTGTYPWTHRALHHFGTPLDTYTSQNIFKEFGSGKYTRIGFSHNQLTNILLHQFKENLEEFPSPDEVSLVDLNISDYIFDADFSVAYQSERRYLKNSGHMSNSLYLHPIVFAIRKFVDSLFDDRYRAAYPSGVPSLHDMYFPLEDTIDWIMKQIKRWEQPFLAYLHMMPPHNPYRPRREFTNLYRDGWHPEAKPDHFFADFDFSQTALDINRIAYDQYVAYVDAEFSRLHEFMQAEGLYDNTIVVFTSDHGEMFERKIWRHETPTLFQPIINVPLLISIPGQTTRQDVYTPTSCVDILPTLLQLTGRSIPSWIEGLVLPPYVKKEHASDRSIFMVEAKSNAKWAPLRKATVAMIKDDFKLIHYRGYEGYDGVYELYNLREDPEELDNLYATQPTIAAELQQELIAKIEEKDAPFTLSNNG